MKIDLKTNNIICGDNEEWLTHVPDGSVDLCYIDPPFYSNIDREILWGNGYELRSFGDRFSGGLTHYIEWMRPKIELIYKKLKPTASFYLHCDWHASHRLRCVLDDVFGEDNFLNEIVWKRKNGSNSTEDEPRSMANATDSIFLYVKSKEYHFKLPYAAYDEAYLKKNYRFKDKNGDRFAASDLRSPSPRPNLTYNYKGYKPHPNGWSVSKEVMEEMDRKGLLIFPKNKSGRIRKKNYLKDRKGVPVTNLWTDIPFLQDGSPEKIGYPTQKPEALLKRIIEASCPENGLILDCFAGGGTTAKVAADLKRRFIVGDVSPVSIKIITERLLFDCPDVHFEIKNLPQTESELKKMNGHKFAEVVCETMGWEVNDKKTGDGGIDGWAADGTPVQVKNHSKSLAGRPDLQKFYGALGKNKKGIFVAWDFSSEAIEYIAETKRLHKVEIVAKKCSEVFGGLLLDKTKGKEIEELYLERRSKNWGRIAVEAAAKEHEPPIKKAEKGREKTKKGRPRQVSSER